MDAEKETNVQEERKPCWASRVLVIVAAAVAVISIACLVVG